MWGRRMCVCVRENMTVRKRVCVRVILFYSEFYMWGRNLRERLCVRACVHVKESYCVCCERIHVWKCVSEVESACVCRREPVWEDENMRAYVRMLERFSLLWAFVCVRRKKVCEIVCVCEKEKAAVDGSVAVPFLLSFPLTWKKNNGGVKCLLLAVRD